MVFIKMTLRDTTKNEESEADPLDLEKQRITFDKTITLYTGDTLTVKHNVGDEEFLIDVRVEEDGKTEF